MKDIAVVILNWNGRSFLEKFLPQVIACSQDAQIVLADNASTDDSITYVQHHFPEVKIIVNESNGGFAKGYNDALKKVDAPFYVLLNSDVELTENWLQPLHAMMLNPKVAGCQPKVLAFNDRSRFEHAGAAGGYLDRNYFPFCRGRILSQTENDTQQYDNETEIFWATGACMMIRSELFHEVGGFDEDFFAHMEEIDLCWRIKRLGHSFMAVPQSVVYHVGGGTLNYMSPQKTYLNFRNSLYMIIKNHPRILFFKLFYRLSLDGMAALMFLFNGNSKHLWAVYRAHVSMYKNLGLMLRKRRAFKPEKAKFNAKGLYTGSILWAFYFKKIRSFSLLNKRFFQ